MKTSFILCGLLLWTGFGTAEEPAQFTVGLRLAANQKEFLTVEPILVTVEGKSALPASPGKSLVFQITPPVKERKGARPLPSEAKTNGKQSRLYDLLEWYQFPAEGKFIIQAKADGKVVSAPLTITIRRPDKKDSEWGPVDRLHHIPWSNYITDCFCGDTQDVVKRWPESKFAKYCHYYNGMFHQHKKDYDKAIASFTLAAERYPGFELIDAARTGIRECQEAKRQGGAK
jgi:hypothetical protein